MTLLDQPDDERAGVSPAVPAQARRWAATAAMCLGLFLISVDGTVSSIAIPDLQRDLRLSIAEVQWVVDAFAVVMAGTVLAAGTLGDRIGRRRTFNAGLLVCAASAVAGGLAATPAEVILARAAMGAGAALVMPATLSIIIALFPEPLPRRRAITLWAAVAAVGALLGPVLGGWLVDRYSWRSSFWINLPLAAVAAALAAWPVPESRRSGAAPLDRAGAVLSTAGLTTLVWAIVEGPGRGWTDPPVLAAFAGSALLLAAFTAWQAHGRAPMLPLPLLREPRVALGLAAMTLISLAAMGSFLLITLHLQNVLGYSPAAAGVRLLPAMAGLLAGAAVALPLMGRMDHGVILVGIAVTATALAWLTTLTPRTGYGSLAVAQVVLGAGGGMVLTTSTDMVMAAFPGHRAGLGSALNDVTRQVGLALGVAVQGSILASASARRLGELLGDVPGGVDATAVLAAPRAGPGSPSPETVAAARDAFVTGMTSSALAGALTLTAVVVLALCHALRRRLAGARRRPGRASNR
ncbi:MFS transporter [Actinomadura roseirufa]|uniref:MFS transporter n=1 Tax=Actinomadura roseirufa TaxID=2094049 RepID=UPI0010412B50|nr:MFS transporter [Actinomadura roseirufa]